MGISGAGRHVSLPASDAGRSPSALNPKLPASEAHQQKSDLPVLLNIMREEYDLSSMEWIRRLLEESKGKVTNYRMFRKSMNESEK